MILKKVHLIRPKNDLKVFSLTHNLSPFHSTVIKNDERQRKYRLRKRLRAQESAFLKGSRRPAWRLIRDDLGPQGRDGIFPDWQAMANLA